MRSCVVNWVTSTNSSCIPPCGMICTTAPKFPGLWYWHIHQLLHDLLRELNRDLRVLARPRSACCTKSRRVELLFAVRERAAPPVFVAARHEMAAETPGGAKLECSNRSMDSSNIFSSSSSSSTSSSSTSSPHDPILVKGGHWHTHELLHPPAARGAQRAEGPCPPERSWGTTTTCSTSGINVSVILRTSTNCPTSGTGPSSIGTGAKVSMVCSTVHRCTPFLRTRHGKPVWPRARGRWLVVLFPCRSRRLGQEGVGTTQRGRSLVVLRALVRTCTGEAPLLGHVLDSGVGHCLPVYGGLSLP